MTPTSPATAPTSLATARPATPVPQRGYRAGAVTSLTLPMSAPAETGQGGRVTLARGGWSGGASGSAPGGVPDGLAQDRARILRRFTVAAAAILAIGLVVIAGLVMTGQTGGGGLLGRPVAGPADLRPDLAKSCPPPSDGPERTRGAVPPPPPGPRTVDPDAGISYAAYGAPWTTWDQVWSGGTLKVTYRVGQHFITESLPGSGGYHASILSGSVPATVNDAMVLDLECTGRLVAADVRTEYYYQPNTMEMLVDQKRTIGGLNAWVTKFRLHFDRPGLKAKDELAVVVLLDVGRPEAAILYVSIPGTHREWDRIVDEVVDSIRPA